MFFPNNTEVFLKGKMLSAKRLVPLRANWESKIIFQNCCCYLLVVYDINWTGLIMLNWKSGKGSADVALSWWHEITLWKCEVCSDKRKKKGSLSHLSPLESNDYYTEIPDLADNGTYLVIYFFRRIFYQHSWEQRYPFTDIT